MSDYYYDEDNRLIRTELWAKGIKGMVNQFNYSYDNNGNLIKKEDSKGVTTYSYDYENRLTKVTAPDATLSFNYCSCPSLTGICSAGCGEMGADSPSGKRISKTVNGKILYTICFDPTMDFDENGNIIARYVQNPNVLDEPISIETSHGKFYYLFDGLGSVTGLTDNGGNLVASYSYDAFGNILSETGDTTLNAINPYRFTSRVYDKESGLYYYRARYYDANTGRFTQKDPLRSELTEGNNLYVYVGNNPVNRRDPLGLYTFNWFTYKVCFLYWCKTYYYGWKLKLSAWETAGVSLSAGAVAYIALFIPDVTISKIIAGVFGAISLILGACALAGYGSVFYHYYISVPYKLLYSLAGVFCGWCE